MSKLQEKIYSFLLQNPQEWPTQDSQKGVVAEEQVYLDATPVKILQSDVKKQFIKLDGKNIKLSDIVKVAERSGLKVSELLTPCGTMISKETLKTYFNVIESNPEE